MFVSKMAKHLKTVKYRQSLIGLLALVFSSHLLSSSGLPCLEHAEQRMPAMMEEAMTEHGAHHQTSSAESSKTVSTMTCCNDCECNMSGSFAAQVAAEARFAFYAASRPSYDSENPNKGMAIAPFRPPISR